MVTFSDCRPTLPVTDLGKAREYYGTTFGFEEEKEEAGGIYFRLTDGTGFFVYERPTPSKADNTAFGVNVDDLDAAIETLSGKGVAFEEYDEGPGIAGREGPIHEMEDGTRVAWFTDPWNNIVAIGEWTE